MIDLSEHQPNEFTNLLLQNDINIEPKSPPFKESKDNNICLFFLKVMWICTWTVLGGLIGFWISNTSENETKKQSSSIILALFGFGLGIKSLEILDFNESKNEIKDFLINEIDNEHLTTINNQILQTPKITKDVATQTNTTEENKYFEQIVKVEIHNSDIQIEIQPSPSVGIYNL